MAMDILININHMKEEPETIEGEPGITGMYN